MPPFKIEVEGWALHMGLAVVARTAVDAGTDKEHGPWLSILKAADGMRPAESIDIKGRDQLMKLREAIDYALEVPILIALPAAPGGCAGCRYEAQAGGELPCSCCRRLRRESGLDCWQVAS